MLKKPVKEIGKIEIEGLNLEGQSSDTSMSCDQRVEVEGLGLLVKAGQAKSKPIAVEIDGLALPIREQKSSKHSEEIEFEGLKFSRKD